jgi:hypothetical protein
MVTSRVTKLLNAVTSTTTSVNTRISGAQRVGFYIRRANHTSGSSTFTFNGSVADPVAGDGTNLTTVALNVMYDNATGAATHVANKALSSNTSALIWLDSAYLLDFINVTATIATDGDASAWLVEEYWD